MKRKIVLFTDERHMEQANTKLKSFEQDGRMCELIIVKSETNYEEIMTGLSVGTQVLICTEAEEAQVIQRSALSSGFLHDDIFYISPKDKNPRVFCSQCHFIQRVDQKIAFICRNCSQIIQPSDHYSAYHHAFLAYPSFQKG